MAEYLVQGDSITTVANAIRAKTGSSGKLTFPSGFASAISGISTGKQVATGTVTVSVGVYQSLSITVNPGFSVSRMVLYCKPNNGVILEYINGSATVIYSNSTSAATVSKSGTSITITTPGTYTSSETWTYNYIAIS